MGNGPKTVSFEIKLGGQSCVCPKEEAAEASSVRGNTRRSTSIQSRQALEGISLGGSQVAQKEAREHVQQTDGWRAGGREGGGQGGKRPCHDLEERHSVPPAGQERAQGAGGGEATAALQEQMPIQTKRAAWQQLAGWRTSPVQPPSAFKTQASVSQPTPRQRPRPEEGLRPVCTFLLHRLMRPAYHSTHALSPCQKRSLQCSREDLHDRPREEHRGPNGVWVHHRHLHTLHALYRRQTRGGGAGGLRTENAGTGGLAKEWVSNVCWLAEPKAGGTKAAGAIPIAGVAATAGAAENGAAGAISCTGRTTGRGCGRGRGAV